MSDEQWRFSATHYAGTQKMLRADVDRLRAINPGFIILHYRLGLGLGDREPGAGCQPTGNWLAIIEGNDWVREYPDTVQESWFYHYPEESTSRVFNCDWGWYLMNLDDNGWRSYWRDEVLRQLQANDDEWIPNRNVYVYNNVFYNPSSARTMWSHFTVLGPITPPPNTNIPSPSASDANLRIRGNMIWNGPSDLPLGVGDIDQGCQASNPTCNPAQLVADNAVNLVEPHLLDPAHGNFRPYPGGTLFTVTTYAIPDFGWDDAPTTPGVPPGTFSNSVLNDRDGNMRAPAGPPGAYAVITQQQTTSSISTSSTSSGPASLSTTSTMPTTNTVPTSLSTYSGSTSPAAPPGPGIPGFPVEAIVFGVIVGLFMLSLRRVRKKS